MFEFRYHTQCPRRKSHFPFVFHAITVNNEEGEQVGYLTVEHVKKEFVQQMEENPFVYLAAFQGEHSLFKNRKLFQSYDAANPIEFNFELNMPNVLEYMEKKYLIPHGEHEGLSAEELEVFLPDWIEKIRKNPGFSQHWEASKEYNFDKPMIHYIKVEEGYRGCGLGMELYRQSSILVQNQFGVQLHSSTNQSALAQRCWKKMKELGWVEEVALQSSKPYGKEMRYKLNAEKMSPVLKPAKTMKKEFHHGI